MNKKRHFLYSSFYVWYALFASCVTIVLCLYAIVQVWKNAVAVGDYFGAVFFALFMAGLVVGLGAVFYIARMHDRWFTKVYFDSIGIHYYCIFGRKSHTVRWDNIRTYGFYGSKAGYMSFNLMFFSTDPNEKDDAKHRARFSEGRVPMEYRPELWYDLVEHMPRDIYNYLAESIRTGKSCYVRRKLSKKTDGSLSS